MAEWLEQASQWHEMYCHDLEVMSLSTSRVELGVRSTSVLSRTWSTNIIVDVPPFHAWFWYPYVDYIFICDQYIHSTLVLVIYSPFWFMLHHASDSHSGVYQLNHQTKRQCYLTTWLNTPRPFASFTGLPMNVNSSSIFHIMAQYLCKECWA